MTIMRVLGTVVLTVVLMLVGIGVGAYLYLKQHTFTARVRPPAIEITMADFVRDVSTPKYTRDLKDPLPATPENLEQGRSLYVHDCAMCHGVDGSAKTTIGGGLYPPTPSLRDRDTQSMTGGELYYVIKNGIPFSGMPAFSAAEEDYWKLVHFIRHLPQITQAEIEKLQPVTGNPVE